MRRLVRSLGCLKMVYGGFSCVLTCTKSCGEELHVVLLELKETEWKMKFSLGHALREQEEYLVIILG